MKKVVIASTHEDAERLIRLNQPHSDTLFIATDWSALVAFQEAKVPYKYVEDYLDPENFAEITQRAFDITAKWYKDSSLKSQFTFHGISIGLSIEHQLAYYLIGLMKTIHILENIIKVENPKTLIAVKKIRRPPCRLMISHYEYPYEQVLPFVAGRNKTKIEWINESARNKVSAFVDKYFIKIKVPIPRFLVSAGIFFLSCVLSARNMIFSRRYKGLKRIVFLANELSVPKAYKNVMDELSAGGDLLSIILAQRKTIFNPRKLFSEKNIYYRFSDSFISLKDRIQISLAARRLTNLILTSKVFGSYFRFNEYSMVTVDRQRFIYLSEGLMRAVMKNIIAMHNFIAREDIRLIVVMSEAWEYFRSAVQVANKEKVPTLIILHGVATVRPTDLPGLEPRLATQMATWGSLCDDALISMGIDKDRLTQTGNPHFDLYYKGDKKNIKDIYVKFPGLDQKNKIITYIASRMNKGVSARGITFSFKEREEMLEAVIEAVNELDGVQLVIKASPGDESEDRLKYIAGKYSHKNIPIYKDCNLAELLRLSDVVITYFSTVGLEAMIFKKPVILINFSDIPDRMDYVKEGAAIGLYKREDTAIHIKKVLWDPDTIKRLDESSRIYLEKYTGLQDGRASSRVVNLIRDMVEDNKGKYRKIIEKSAH